MRPASSPAEPAAPGAGEGEGCVAPPTATGVAGGVLPGLALTDAEALTDRLGLGVALTVGLGVAGRAVAATGVGRGVAGTVTVIWPAGRSAALPWAVAEKVTVRVPAENRLDPRQLPFEVVPLTRLSGTVAVPTCATTLVAGLPE